MIFSLTAGQRNALIVKYAEAYPETQPELDGVLKKLVKMDHQVMIKYKTELEKESMSKLGKMVSRNHIL
jgi:hypothetical protein